MSTGRYLGQKLAACALAGVSWPYASADRVLQQLCGEQVSAEVVRSQAIQQGGEEAGTQQAEADRVLQPTAIDVRTERDWRDHGRSETSPRVASLWVWMGGWVPSREQEGGMEGKVGVVATGTQPVGMHRRQRLCPRRYVVTFGSSEQVGTLAAAAVALQGYAAPEQVVLGDGAAWIKTQADEQFPDALGDASCTARSRICSGTGNPMPPWPSSRICGRPLLLSRRAPRGHGAVLAGSAALAGQLCYLAGAGLS